MEATRVRLTIPDSIDPTLIMGPADSLLRRIEESFDAMVVVRGNQISVVGPSESVDQVTSVFSRLIKLAGTGETPTQGTLELIIDQVSHGAERMAEMPQDVLHTTRGKTIRPKTAGQERYVRAIRENTITFGIGPAGTGKTYLAMALAVAALKRKDVGRIVLTRPVVEAGESLGYLPGTLEEKLDPYVRPLYDALFDMVDAEHGRSLIEQGVVEIAPLAFMRGRTLNDAFVIFDEAQNSTPEQMKMFLTRLGFGSKFVITGDRSQKDLLGRNGLDSASEVLKDVDDIAFVNLDRNDIVRHTLVAKIVDAYAAHDAEAAKRAGRA